MQIKCGQCGALHDLEWIEGMQSARCAYCGHAVVCLDLKTDPPSETVCEGRFADDEDDFARQARQALRERMLVVCAHCGARIRVAKRLEGQVIHCTACRGELRVPDTSAEDQVDIAYLISPSDLVMGRDPRAAGSWRARAAKRRRQRARRRRLQRALKAAVALLLAALVASVLWRGADSSDQPKRDLARRDLSPTDKAGDLPTARTEEGEKGESALAGPATAAATVSSAAAGRSSPAAALVGEPIWSVFASGGYYPARPDRLYCVVPVQLAAKEEAPQPFDPAAAELVLAERVYSCLGEVVENAPLPLLARRRILRVSPVQPLLVRLLFELPSRPVRGTLRLGAFGDVVVQWEAPAPSQTVPVGAFEEEAPRNLKPLLEDPVMRAIQSTPRQVLRLERNGSLLDVRIDEADVIGQARRVAADRYAVVLRRGPHSLEGTLRVLPDGERIILYLREAPLHQVTYRRKAVPSSPGREAPPGEPDDSPRFFGV